MIKQTTVQVSVGMRPSCSTKSTGVSMRGANPCLERDPLRHITVERSSEKERWHLSQPITLLYGCSRLAAMRVASRLYVTVAAFFIDEGTALPLHVIHLFRAGTVYFSRGFSNSAPGMSAGVSSMTRRFAIFTKSTVSPQPFTLLLPFKVSRGHKLF